jgi:hypothetical protein
VRLLQPDTDFVDLVKSFDNGSAPGPSGWTARLIIRTLHDETCLTGYEFVLTSYKMAAHHK